MSLFNRLQKALGFAYEDEQTDVTETVASDAVRHYAMASATNGVSPDMKQGNPPSAESTQSVAAGMSPEEIDPSIIFRGVVDILNRELPPYLRQALDEERQTKYLLENIDSAMKDYIAAIAAKEREKVQKARENERDRLKRNFDEIKEKLRNTEEHLTRESERALSAERQKRALAGRIKDLEEKVAALLAEKEQYDLENRSLLNKLRVAEITGKSTSYNNGESRDSEESQKKIDSLQQELQALRTAQKDVDALQQEIEKLRESEQELSRLRLHYRDLEAENDRLKAQTTVNHPVYEFISFDEAESAPEDNTVREKSQPDIPKVSVPSDNPKPTKNADEPKKKRNTRKVNRTDSRVDMLSDTDWLVEAAAEMDNPDLLITPGNDTSSYQTAINKENDNITTPTSDFPEQMSLW